MLATLISIRLQNVNGDLLTKTPYDMLKNENMVTLDIKKSNTT